MAYWKDWVVINEMGKPFIDVSLSGKMKFGSVRGFLVVFFFFFFFFLVFFFFRAEHTAYKSS